MLLRGVDHLATLTSDSDRLHEFYVGVFDATVESDGPGREAGSRMSILNVGPSTELNVFEIEGNDQPERQTPMFGRGRIDHVGFEAADIESFEEIRRRLRARGAADDYVTDFGRKLSLFFTDPDGLEGEVLVANPDAVAGVRHPPGTRAARYPAGS